jgi:hypothetical protein
MKLRVFGWLIVGCLLYVCPNAMAQSISFDIIGSQTSDPATAGIKPGGANWSITSGKCDLSDSGALSCKIKGLVITGTTSASPVTNIAISLVCGGAVAASSDSVALSSAGDAKLKGTLTLPSRCFTPALLVQVTGITGTPTVPLGTAFIGGSGFSGAGTDVRQVDLPPDR